MGDLASDHDAAIELVIEEYESLRRREPGHHLLGFLQGVSDVGFDYNPARWTEFCDRYARGDRTPYAVLLAGYFVDLRNATAKHGTTLPVPSGRGPEQLYLFPVNDLPTNL